MLLKSSQNCNAVKTLKIHRGPKVGIQYRVYSI